jgi:hypothetical protein
MTAQGQTAADIERLLDAQEITCSQAAYFVLAASLETRRPVPKRLLPWPGKRAGSRQRPKE